MTSTDQKTVDFQVVPMPGDGGCLFHSLCYILHGHIRLSQDIRRQIVSHVVNNWDRFKVWTDDGIGDNYQTKDHYKREMLNPLAYGSSCELMAAAELFSCRFRVYRNGEVLYTFGQTSMPLKYLKFTGDDLSVGHFDVFECLNSKNLDAKSLMRPVVCLDRLTKAEHNLKKTYSVNDNVIEKKQKTHETLTDSDITTKTIFNKTSKRKRVRRRGSCTDGGKRKKYRETVANILQTNEVHKDSIAEYSQTNQTLPEDYVAEYSQTNVTFHKNVVDKYSQVNPKVEVNADAFVKYYKSSLAIKRAFVSRHEPNDKKRQKRIKTKLAKKHSNVVNKKAVDKYLHINPTYHEDAITKYLQVNSLVQIDDDAVAKYYKANPEIKIDDVSSHDPNNEKRKKRKKKCLAQKQPKVFHEDAVDKYSQVNLQVLIDDDDFAKYYKSNPDVNRTSVSKHDPNSEKRLKRKKTCLDQIQPKVFHEDAVAKYSQANPQVQINADAVAKYYKSGPEIRRASVSRRDPNNDKQRKRKKH